MIIKPPIRQQDRMGAGWFGAPRGDRVHNGIDLCCHKGSIILAPVTGCVTKIGYPYNPNDKKKGHLRYVEVTTNAGARHRTFYIEPKVKVGDVVHLNKTVIGVSQGLLDIYPTMTDHVHYEIIFNGKYVDPTEYVT